MPHLLVPSLSDAIVRSRAVKSLTLNLSASDGETRDLSLGEHLVSLPRHAPSLRLDYVLVDEATIGIEPELEQRARDMFDAKLRVHPLSSRRAGQHDSLKLAACYRD
ncbi:2-phospho-L-lactate transferase CofD family protein, partial [Burkholderia multivorans]|uniref:2-phospho-L-lactate transferase CofD family protein n=1 Tax=Burkholderia multivorans TaxID=87883 RepID=UPI0021ABAB33